MSTTCAYLDVMRGSAWPRKFCTACRWTARKYPNVPAVWRKKQRPRVISCAEGEAFNPRRLPDCRLVTPGPASFLAPVHTLRCFRASGATRGGPFPVCGRINPTIGFPSL
jgi:hypothetical protein